MLPILVEYRNACDTLDELLKLDRYKKLLTRDACCIGCSQNSSLRSLFATFLQEALVKQGVDPVLLLEADAKSKQCDSGMINTSMRFNGLTAKLDWRSDNSSICFGLEHVREAIAEYCSRKYATTWSNDEPVC